MSIEHKWRPMFRYVPKFWIPNVNIPGDGRAPITLENRGFRNRAAWVLTGGRSNRMESGLRKITDALRRLKGDGLAVRYLPVSNAEAFAHPNTPDEVQKYLNG